ncbi:hypothetical protein KY290_021342 [Solanum tuberosum]|uniref:PB1-like domain-containing protein n=1 Tax=Solanum tuberosum TaxID=4113 RepID=A0ABQ7V1A2_SOLTU|nr:hypothetical protein KY289_020499 [Solanum tuberosum]KAH0693162.1 hypothetical protein KY285_020259 [Solanum tuberosum]KAH0757849.1 hypothetical protein KY290_021342 [Solanum tuberosum]
MATKYLNLRFKFGGILVSEVGPIYVGGRTEYVENVDEDHLSIPELADYAKPFGISKLGKTYAKTLGGDLVELKNDMDICNIALFMHDGDTIDIYVCDDTILEDVGPSEDLGLGSSSSFPSSERVENDGVARVQQETNDDYYSIDWTDTEEEGEPIVQQGTEPSIQEESTTGKKRGRGQYERASSSKTGTRRGARSGYKKRPKVQGLSCSRRVNTGVVSSAHVIGDIGLKPTKGLKWKGKQAMTQRELQVQSVMLHIQTRSKAAGIQIRAQAKGKSPSKKTS